MTGHSTRGPVSAAVVCCGGPADDATVTAAFAELVCADSDLLRAAFEAIIAAAFPDPAEGSQLRGPSVTVATVTDRVAPRDHPGGCGSRHLGGGVAGSASPRPRERGPPIQPPGERGELSASLA